MATDFASEIADLRATLKQITLVSDPEALRARIALLEQEASAPDLWDDVESAQQVTSRLSHAQHELNRLDDLAAAIDDLETLVELAGEEDDADSLAEAEKELLTLRKQLADLEVRTLLSGEYDAREAVVTIRSGAGGVDAADFAEMLLRMYLRWAERNGYPAKVLDTSYAEEAGLKSATFEVKAPFAFGTLSVEAGTHRLVRISPFDNQGRRQTSFAAVEVVPLIEQTDHIEIPDNEIKVDVFRSSGPGGQSVNTTDSAVRLTHLPTGVVVSMQNEKSQIQNRAAAMRVLQSRLLLLKQQEEAAKKKELAGDVKASWGDQMRSYVLQPYQMVKDLRTEHESGNPSAVFDGDIKRLHRRRHPLAPPGAAAGRVRGLRQPVSRQPGHLAEQPRRSQHLLRGDLDRHPLRVGPRPAVAPGVQLHRERHRLGIPRDPRRSGDGQPLRPGHLRHGGARVALDVADLLAALPGDDAHEPLVQREAHRHGVQHPAGADGGQGRQVVVRQELLGVGRQVDPHGVIVSCRGVARVTVERWPTPSPPDPT